MTPSATITAPAPRAEPRPAAPPWYREAVIYQVRVGTFFDSDGDGIGDFKGLTLKLDYLADLGVTALWLLPFYPSPLRDDGYDIADYTSVRPEFGTLGDFRTFLHEARRHGIKVITELVLNHTSDRHPWFQRARRAPPGSRLRDWYVWSPDAARYKDARVIFRDFESSNWSWDEAARSYYWHRFYSHQPDLNYENPAVRREMLRVVDFWLRLGVDGLRLDAVPYLFEEEGTSCENLPRTHAFLKQLRAHVDRDFPDRMLLAEANQWPEDAAAYFGAGDECHMAFHFPLMPRLFMALHMEDRFPLLDILDQTPPIPDPCQWALFLRNHDELTLEMVTEEERDYMNRFYAFDAKARLNLGIRRRLAPLLDNNRRKIELMNGLLLSLPGTPIVYYGDEIGMGDNFYLTDRNGVRTPMQWSSDRNAGFSRANPQKLTLPVIIDPEYHYETVNVEAQAGNASSLYWWMKRLVALRKRFAAFGSGSFAPVPSRNARVLAFTRELGPERILVVANLSRFAQCVELDLCAYEGRTPVELFGRAKFPAVTRAPYLMTLAPHGFFWLSLERPASEPAAAGPPLVETRGGWQSALSPAGRAPLEAGLPAYLRRQRWFAGKARAIIAASFDEAVPLPDGAVLTLVSVRYAEGPPELYQLPLAFASGEKAGRLAAASPDCVAARLRTGDGDGIVYDACFDPGFGRLLLDLITRRRRLKGRSGELWAAPSPALRGLLAEPGPLEPAPSKAEQSNTSLVFGRRLILKLYRRVAEGVNPDLELSRLLNLRCGYPNVAPLGGALEYRGAGEPMSLGILQGFVPNEGDAWSFMQADLGRYLEASLAGSPGPAGRAVAPAREPVLLLGRRVAELHAALASLADERACAPQPFDVFYQRSLYQGLRSLCGQTLALLRERHGSLGGPARELAAAVLERQGRVLEAFRGVLRPGLGGQRLRHHGDLHLGQVLRTGSDFVLIDFEGEPARPVSERRMKRSPLRDAAGMLRSFHYAAAAALANERERGASGAAMAALERAARAWRGAVSDSFLEGYRSAAAGAAFLPASDEETGMLLRVFTLEKAVYETAYELNNRPEWAATPLEGILELVD